jgi:transposase
MCRHDYYDRRIFTDVKAICPHCGNYTPNIHRKNRHTHVLIPPVNGHRAILRLRQTSYACLNCNRTFTPKIPGVAKRNRMTVALQDLIQRMASDHSFEQISREVGAHRSVARDIFINHPKTLQKLKARRTPRILGIDGLYLGVSRTCLTDLDTHSIWDVWEISGIPSFITLICLANASP